MIQEYMMSTKELKDKFPLNSIHEINGIYYKVKKINEAMPAQGFATYPSVTFDKFELDKDVNENETEYDNR